MQYQRWLATFFSLSAIGWIFPLFLRRLQLVAHVLKPLSDPPAIIAGITTLGIFNHVVCPT